MANSSSALLALFRSIVFTAIAFVSWRYSCAGAEVNEATPILEIWNQPHSRDLEVALRESYSKARKLISGHRSDELSQILIKSDEPSFTTQNGLYNEFIARRDIIVDHGGVKQDLVIVVFRDSAANAYCESISLRSAPNVTINEAIKSNLYPKRGLIDTILRLSHYRLKTRKFPILTSVDFRFGEILEPGCEYKGLGYSVMLNNAEAVNAVGVKKVCYVMYRTFSGLDPIFDMATDREFKPSGHLYSTRVFFPMTAISPKRSAPAIWVTVESE